MRPCARGLLVPPYELGRPHPPRRRAISSRQQNPDGGFGDTDLSHSNIATTYLVVAALHLAGVADQHAALLAAGRCIPGKQRPPGRPARALRHRQDVRRADHDEPGAGGPASTGARSTRCRLNWPACRSRWYRFVGMPVVSYAIPALVAIGQARYFHAPPWNPLTRLVRWLSITRSLKVLRRMQPDSGGYLEATPLTSFVVMSLASIPKPRPGSGRSRGSPRSETTVQLRGLTSHPRTASNSSPTPSAPTGVGRSTRTSPPGTPRWRSTPWPARVRMSRSCLSARDQCSTESDARS